MSDDHIDSLDSHGMTALMRAACDNNADEVRRLLSHGANPHIKDRLSRQTALQKARNLGNNLCVEILSGAEKDIAPPKPLTPEERRAQKEVAIGEERTWQEVFQRNVGAQIGINLEAKGKPQRLTLHAANHDHFVIGKKDRSAVMRIPYSVVLSVHEASVEEARQSGTNRFEVEIYVQVLYKGAVGISFAPGALGALFE